MRELSAPIDDAESFRAWVAPHLLAMARLATRLTYRWDNGVLSR